MIIAPIQGVVTKARHELRETLDPSAIPDTGILTVRDDGGDSELFFDDDKDRTTQITKDGALNVPAGITLFTGLTDTPGSYAGSANFLVRVNGTPDALEFLDPSTDFLAQYALLAGRSGGQIIIGGLDAADPLTLRATANATPGDVIIQSEPGVEVARFDASPQGFRVNGTTLFPGAALNEAFTLVALTGTNGAVAVLSESDALGSNDALVITNFTSTVGSFSPFLNGHVETISTVPAMTVMGSVLAARDTGTVPVIRLDARRSNFAADALITTRPLLSLFNFTTERIRITATGVILTDGQAASTTPSFASIDDSDTGLGFPLGDRLAMVCGGVTQVTYDNPGGTITYKDAVDLVFNATTGTKIATAGSQKIAFYGATPIIQPTGVAVSAAGIHAALVSLGLITA